MKGTSLVPVGVVLGASACLAGCVSVAPEPRGATRAQYTGAVPLVFTNASPARVCGLYLSYDKEPDHGDNWLPVEGLASGASIELQVRPGRYKARWDTCREGRAPFYAATLWRETSAVVDSQTQLYAYVADSVPPTKRAATRGRDFRVVRFPGQLVDGKPPPQPAQQVALRGSSELDVPQIGGFVGRVPLSPDEVAARPPVLEKFDAREFVDPRATFKPKAPKAPARPAPSLSRKHDLADSTIQLRKR